MKKNCLKMIYLTILIPVLLLVSCQKKNYYASLDYYGLKLIGDELDSNSEIPTFGSFMINKAKTDNGSTYNMDFSVYSDTTKMYIYTLDNNGIKLADDADLHILVLSYDRQLERISINFWITFKNPIVLLDNARYEKCYFSQVYYIDCSSGVQSNQGIPQLVESFNAIGGAHYTNQDFELLRQNNPQFFTRYDEIVNEIFDHAKNEFYTYTSNIQIEKSYDIVEITLKEKVGAGWYYTIIVAITLAVLALIMAIIALMFMYLPK